MWARSALSLIELDDDAARRTRCDIMGAALSANSSTSKRFFLNIIDLISNLMSPRRCGLGQVYQTNVPQVVQPAAGHRTTQVRQPALPVHSLLSLTLFISAIMRLTSGGNARPLRSLSAGTARAAAPSPAGTELPGLEVETAETRFSGAAFSAAAAPCLGLAVTGRVTNSSYPQRSHCHEGNTSSGSPALWYTARSDGMILPPQRGHERPRVVRRSTSIFSCAARSAT